MTILNDAYDTATDVGKDVADAIASPVPDVIKAVQVGLHAVDQVMPGTAFRTTHEWINTVHAGEPGAAPHTSIGEPSAHPAADFAFGAGCAHLSELVAQATERLHDAFGHGAAAATGTASTFQPAQHPTAQHPIAQHTDHWAAADHDANHHTADQHHEVDDHNDAWSAHDIHDVHHDPVHNIVAQQPGHEIPDLVT